MISISLDVTLVDKTRLKPFTRRDGKKAMFLELILVETPNSDYGDYIVKQSVSKEEREQRLEMPILGNAKNLFKKGSRQVPEPAPESDQPEDSEVPF